MALSNIRNEPRRELTEQLIGALVFCIPAWIIYRMARAMQTHDRVTDTPFIIHLIFATLIFLIGSAFTGGVIVFMHFLGESVCNFLADRGLELRPKNRPGR